MNELFIREEDDLKNKELQGIYFIRNIDNGYLKIGKTNNFKRRLREIERSFKFCGHMPKLKVEGFIEYNKEDELELYLHSKFSDFKVQNEWFNINDLDCIKIAINEYTPPVKEVKIVTKTICKNDNKSNKRDIDENNNTYKYYMILTDEFRQSRDDDFSWMIIRGKKGFNSLICKLDKISYKITGCWNTYSSKQCMLEEGAEDMALNFIKNNTSVLIEFEKLKTDYILITNDGNRKYLDYEGELTRITNESKLKFIHKSISDISEYLYKCSVTPNNQEELDKMCKNICSLYKAFKKIDI